MAKDKKKDGKKSEKSVRSPAPAQDAAVESSSVKPASLPTLDGGEDPQANPLVPDEEPEAVEEPPVQHVLPHPEEPLLARIIVERYEGEKVHGLYEGEGVAYFEGGNTYKGMFSEGLMHGQGTYTWADGVKYKGTFVKNVQMYNGCYTWSDGSTYEGSISNGVRHGFGLFRSGTRPVSYAGCWCKGKRQGKGTIYYNQEHTSWYSGDWVNNNKDGWGIRCYKSGNIYEGQWEKNVRHGKGRMRWLTANQEYIGQWEHGIQHGFGTHIWFLRRMPLSQYPLRNKYIGDFVNGDRHGHGRFIYASGAVYDGEWVCNKKHGRGKFVFKSGHVYEGEFIDDHIAEYPAFQVDTLIVQDLNAICTQSPFGTVLKISFFFFFLTCLLETIRIVNGSRNTSLLGPNIELDIFSLLDLFPKEKRQEEVKQTEFAVLRHMTELRRIYSFYSSLGCDHSLDNTFLMTKLQFWRFLKDCQFHHCNLTLAEMDRILSGDKIPLEEIHSPYETLLFRAFLSCLIRLAFHIYHKEHKEEGPYLHKCFLEMMCRNVIPTACHTQGILFSERAACAMSYIDKCWEIYRAFCRPSTKSPFEPTMKMRHFLWMLKDFKLLSKQLTAPRLVEILVKDHPFLCDGSNSNLEQELVFLEFVEALLDCALVYVTRDVIKQQVDHCSQKGSSFRIENLSEGTTAMSQYPECSLSQVNQQCCLPPFSGYLVPSCRTHSLVSLLAFILKRNTLLNKLCNLHVTEKLEDDKNEQNEEVGLQLCQVQIFFISKFFPAYQHEQVLKEKIKENRIRDAEIAELRKLKDEELAKEAEVAKRQEAAAEKASSELKDAVVQESESVAQLARPPKEEAPIVPPPVVTKVAAGTKKKK
ncbi:R10B2 protein, partial [Dromaius novaehollandiae]|nr:R10B2 protein [Dromaius novaehollandiae]